MLIDLFNKTTENIEKSQSENGRKPLSPTNIFQVFRLKNEKHADFFQSLEKFLEGERSFEKKMKSKP